MSSYAEDGYIYAVTGQWIDDIKDGCFVLGEQHGMERVAKEMRRKAGEAYARGFYVKAKGLRDAAEGVESMIAGMVERVESARRIMRQDDHDPVCIDQRDDNTDDRVTGSILGYPVVIDEEASE